jgi:hypothetical protein
LIFGNLPSGRKKEQTNKSAKEKEVMARVPLFLNEFFSK